jgi:hypothetical protein
MPPTKTTPVARTKPDGAPGLSDAYTLDLFFKIADNHGRLRARVDAMESRIRYLETLLDTLGGR